MAVRIAYNALAARPGGTGVQTYIREFLHALCVQYPGTNVAFSAAVQDDAVGELPPSVEPVRSPVAAGLRRAVTGFRSLGPADLVHGLDVDVPIRADAPVVATVHDMTPFDFPSTMSRRKAIGERLLYRRALRRADAVVAVSSFTAERVHALLGVTAIPVLSGAPTDLRAAADDAISAVRTRFGLPDVFVLHVGTLEPRKDVDTVAAACRAAGIELVLAGRVPPRRVAPRSARVLGYVSRSDLPALYGAATITAVPSRYEGFGFPALEAMLCDSPVVASRVASLPEVLGDAAVLVPPADVDAWTTAIREVVADGERRAELRAAGHAHATSLTWDATAAATAAVYASLGVALSERR